MADDSDTARPPRRNGGAGPGHALRPSLSRTLGAAKAKEQDARRKLAALTTEALDDDIEDEITAVDLRVEAVERKLAEAESRPTMITLGEIELHGPGGLRARIEGISGWQTVLALVLIVAVLASVAVLRGLI